jgi:hypothetical protein
VLGQSQNPSDDNDVEEFEKSLHTEQYTRPVAGEYTNHSLQYFSPLARLG